LHVDLGFIQFKIHWTRRKTWMLWVIFAV